MGLSVVDTPPMKSSTPTHHCHRSWHNPDTTAVSEIREPSCPGQPQLPVPSEEVIKTGTDNRPQNGFVSGFGVTLFITHPSPPTTHLSIRRDAHPPEPALVLLSSPPFPDALLTSGRAKPISILHALVGLGHQMGPCRACEQRKSFSASQSPLLVPCVWALCHHTAPWLPAWQQIANRALALRGAVWLSLCPCSALCCGVERWHQLGKGAGSDGLPG